MPQWFFKLSCFKDHPNTQKRTGSTQIGIIFSMGMKVQHYFYEFNFFQTAFTTSNIMFQSCTRVIMCHSSIIIHNYSYVYQVQWMQHVYCILYRRVVAEGGEFFVNPRYRSEIWNIYSNLGTIEISITKLSHHWELIRLTLMIT